MASDYPRKYAAVKRVIAEEFSRLAKYTNEIYAILITTV
jgi:hypothetical protein